MDVTNQSLFDQVWDHFVLLDSPKSVDGCRGPMYRCRGNKCAVGVLLTDDEYMESMEGLGVRDLADRQILPARLMPHLSLLDELQKCHDYNKREDIEAALKRVALGFDLELP